MSAAAAQAKPREGYPALNRGYWAPVTVEFLTRAPRVCATPTEVYVCMAVIATTRGSCSASLITALPKTAV